MKKIIVAVDGYSSCGKSTIAKSLANYAGYTYIDTGAMYRAAALYAIQEGLMNAETIHEQALREKIGNIHIDFRRRTAGEGQDTFLNGENVESIIRTLEVANAASRISTLAFVREELVRQQQEMGRDKGIVMDGRDIGTVVFPQAELKLFLTASPEIRAQRRFDELRQKGIEEDYQSVLSNVIERDYRDTHREQSPLKQADDAILLDNSQLTIEQQNELVRKLFEEKTVS
ncbi:MAG: (d)CMP kinase [Paludibacteraceae bacterium]|nr:(d)CMP kinase [Paludibacteraceae bacterium]